MVNQNIQPNEIADSLKDLLQRLKADREKIDGEIKRVETQLAKLSGDTVYQQPTKRRRSPRGANKDTVKKALTENLEKQFSVGEVADLVKLQPSSVRYVLKQLDKEGIAKEVSTGYWQAVKK
jgi:Fic family protein